MDADTLSKGQEVLAKSQEVLAQAREEMPVVREALSEMRTEPKNAFAKLAAVVKDIWAKIMEVGLFGAIFESIKALFGGAVSAVGGRPSTLADNIPDVPTVAPPAPPSTSAAPAPLHAGEAAPLLAAPQV